VEGGFNAFFLNDNPNILDLTGAGSGNIDGTSFVNFAAIDMRGGQDTANIAAAGSFSGLLDGGADADVLNLNEAVNTLNLNADLSGTIQAGTGSAPLTAIAGFETIRLAAGSDTANINLDQNIPAAGSPRQALTVDGGTDAGTEASTDALNLTLSAADLNALQASNSLQALLAYLANPSGLTYTAALANTDLTLTGFETASLSNIVNQGPGTPGVITADGALQEGVTLSAPSITGDPNGDAAWDAAGANPEYQWLFNGVAIVGATGSTYTVPLDAIAAADPSAQYSVDIIYTDAQGFRNTASPVTAAPLTVAKVDNGDASFQLQSAGSPLTAPVAVGTTITAAQLLDDSDGNLLAGTTVTYLWQTRASATDPWSTVGSNTGTYTPTTADAGKQLQLLISYTDGQGYSESLSALTASVEEQTPPPPPPSGSIIKRSIDELSLLISGLSGPGKTTTIEKLGLVPTTRTIGRGRRRRTVTVNLPGWQTVDTLDSIDGLTLTAGDGLNTISAAGDRSNPAKPAFDGQFIADGRLGVDVLTGGSYRNWLIGGGIVTPGSKTALSGLGIDILNGTTGALDVFDLRSSDGASDAYANPNGGRALINNFTVGEDAIVLSGAEADYNVNINTVMTGRGRRARSTTTVEIRSASTSEVIASFSGTAFSSTTTAADLNINYGITGAPAATEINGQLLFI
jgi:hypothetical protein